MSDKMAKFSLAVLKTDKDILQAEADRLGIPISNYMRMILKLHLEELAKR